MELIVIPPDLPKLDREAGKRIATVIGKIQSVSPANFIGFPDQEQSSAIDA
jgi:hypothetical protein